MCKGVFILLKLVHLKSQLLAQGKTVCDNNDTMHVLLLVYCLIKNKVHTHKYYFHNQRNLLNTQVLSIDYYWTKCYVLFAEKYKYL